MTSQILLSIHRLDAGWMFHQAEQRRSVRLLLALKAYQLKHGKLPERLDALVGEYFTVVPKDVWTGREFGYRPHGFPNAVMFGVPRDLVIPAGTPLIWSAGPERIDVIAIAGALGEKPTYQMVDQFGNPLGGAQQARYGYGIAYPIP